MNYIKKYLCLGLLLSIGAMQSDCSTPCVTGSSASCSTSCSNSTSVKTIFLPIAQGANLYTQYHKYIVDYENDRDWYIDTSVTYRYQQSRNGNDIAASLFNAQCGTLLFQGSNYGIPSSQTGMNPDFIALSKGPRNPNALLADYFGMGPNTNVSVQLNPKITNNIFDIQLSAGIDCLCEGLWFQMNLPVVNSKWNLNTCTQLGTADTTALQAGPSSYTIKNATAPTLGDLNATETPQVLQGWGTSPLNIELAGLMSQGQLISTLVQTTSGTPATTDVVNTTGGSQCTLSPAPTVGPGLTAGATFEIPYSYMGMLTVAQGTGTTAPTPLTNKAQQLVVNNIITQPLVASAVTLQAALNGYTFGDLKTRSYNLVNLNTTGTSCSTSNNNCSNSCSNSIWALDGVYLQLGYDIWRCDTWHAGVYAKAILPTGTSFCANYMKYTFSPIVGNGKHYELGGGISAGAEVWCNDCDSSTLKINFDGYATHMFSNTQFRTFDIATTAGTILPMSRYMLLKQFTQDSTVAAGNCSDAIAYGGVLVSAGDVNAQNVCISVAARGEAVLDIVYRHCDWELGGGYAFSGQTAEKFSTCSNSCSTSCTTPAASTTGFLYGFKGLTDESDLLLTVNATPTTVTGTGTSLAYVTLKGDVVAVSVKTNSDIDPKATAYSYDPTRITGQTPTVAADLTNGNLFTLPAPNCSGLMNGQMLHRLFGHVDYVWSDSCWMPTLGVVGSVGFSTSSNITAEYWDIGARFGFAY